MTDFEALAQELVSPMPEVRQKAVVGLVETSDLRALPLLARAATQDPNTKVRFLAKRGLLLLRQRGAAGPRPAGKVSGLQPRLPDPRELLAKWRELAVEDRIRAIQRMSAYGDGRLVPYYTRLLKVERDPYVRSKLVVSLGILGDPVALPVLRVFLADPDARVRANAVEAIGYIGGDKALPLLFAALAGQVTPRIVRNVRQFLERGNDAEFESFLTLAFQNGRAAVRQAVLQSVAVLEYDRLYPVLARAAELDDGPHGKRARTELGTLALRGSKRARSLLDRLEGRGAAPEPMGPGEPHPQGGPPAPAATSTGAGNGDVAPEADSASEEAKLQALEQQLSSGDRELLPRLSTRVRYERSPRVRALLVRGLAALGGSEAVTTLLGLLGDPDARVRADAIECLYPFASNPEVSRAARERLEDASGRVRANALVLLGRVPGQDIQKPLGQLASSEEAEDRLRACYVVLDLERDDATLLVAPLLVDDDPRIRRRAREVLQVLADKGNETAMRLLAGAESEVPATLELEPEEDEEPRSPRPPPAPASAAPRVSPPPYEPPRPEPAPTPAPPAPEAARTLEPAAAPVPRPPRLPARSPDPTSDATIEHDRLVYSLESEVEHERIEALRILDEIGDRRAMEPVRRLANDRSEEVRQLAGQVYRSLKDRLGGEAAPHVDEDEIEGLRMRLCHREPEVRLAALKEIGPSHAELREFLMDRIGQEQDARVRASTVLAAGVLGRPADLPGLVTALCDDDARVRANAIEALEYAGDESAIPYIAAFLGDESPRVRHNAADALKHFERARVLAALSAASASEEGWLRSGAVHGLVELGTTDVLSPLLEVVAREENPHILVTALDGIVRNAGPQCGDALREIAGSTQRPRTKEWIGKALEALPVGELSTSFPGAEGIALRLRPSAEDLLRAAKPRKSDEESSPAGEKGQEGRKLALMVSRLREDLYSKESKVRQEAAVRLGRIEHTTSVRVLTVALSHSDSVVQYLARRSLKALVEKPEIFDKQGDMTLSAVKAALLRSERQAAPAGPDTGDQSWLMWWAGILFVMLVLYGLLRPGSPDESAQQPARPLRPAADRPETTRTRRPTTTRSTGAGTVRMGGRDSLPAAGSIEAPPPPSRENDREPADRREFEEVRPEDYPSDPTGGYRPKDEAPSMEPEAEVVDEEREKY